MWCWRFVCLYDWQLPTGSRITSGHTRSGGGQQRRWGGRRLRRRNGGKRSVRRGRQLQRVRWSDRRGSRWHGINLGIFPYRGFRVTWDKPIFHYRGVKLTRDIPIFHYRGVTVIWDKPIFHYRGVGVIWNKPICHHRGWGSYGTHPSVIIGGDGYLKLYY